MRWLGPGVVLCLCVVSLDYLCRWQVRVSVYCGYRHILCAPSVQSCCTLSISASYRVFVCVRYHKSSLISVCFICRTWISLDITLFYEKCHPSSGCAWPVCKKGKSGSHCWGREVSTQFEQQFAKTAVTATPGCVVWSCYHFVPCGVGQPPVIVGQPPVIVGQPPVIVGQPDCYQISKP